MFLNAVAVVDVVLTLIAIVSGFVVAYGLLASKALDGWNKLFLSTTAVLTLTDLMFPFQELVPRYVLAVLALIVMALGALVLFAALGIRYATKFNAAPRRLDP